MANYTVTLEQLRSAGIGIESYNKIVCILKGVEYEPREEYMQFDYKEPISLIDIANKVGLEDAVWCLRITKDDRDNRLFAVWCARQVQHFISDAKNITALDVAEKFANGLATEKDRTAAWTAAWFASEEVAKKVAKREAWSRSAAETAAREAAGSAEELAILVTSPTWSVTSPTVSSKRWSTRWATKAAARTARKDSWVAAETASKAAARAALWGATRNATNEAEWVEAWSAAEVATEAAQKEMFINMCKGEAPWQVK